MTRHKAQKNHKDAFKEKKKEKKIKHPTKKGCQR